RLRAPARQSSLGEPRRGIGGAALLRCAAGVAPPAIRLSPCRAGSPLGCHDRVEWLGRSWHLREARSCGGTRPVPPAPEGSLRGVDSWGAFWAPGDRSFCRRRSVPPVSGGGCWRGGLGVA